MTGEQAHRLSLTGALPSTAPRRTTKFRGGGEALATVRRNRGCNEEAEAGRGTEAEYYDAGMLKISGEQGEHGKEDEKTTVSRRVATERRGKFRESPL